MSGEKQESKAVPDCIHCGGRCVRNGVTRLGKQEYLCRGCGRCHVERTPFVPHRLPDGTVARCGCCGSENVMRWGSCRGRQNFKCRVCERYSVGVYVPPDERVAYPCPYCKERCRKAGRSKRGRPLFFCPSCGRKNTNLYPAPAVPYDGPYPYKLTFCLDKPALDGLFEYCQKYKCNTPQAFRRIFAEAARRPLCGSARAYRGKVRIYYPPVAPEEFLPWRLPDLRPENGRRLASIRRASWEEKVPSRNMTIYVVLNREAYMGLIRTMRLQNLNHQEAARFLLANAR